VEDQALKFEEHKDYLIKVWDQKSAQEVQADCIQSPLHKPR
jgi:hypothetical protein